MLRMATAVPDASARSEATIIILIKIRTRMRVKYHSNSLTTLGIHRPLWMRCNRGFVLGISIGGCFSESVTVLELVEVDRDVPSELSSEFDLSESGFSFPSLPLGKLMAKFLLVSFGLSLCDDGCIGTSIVKEVSCNSKSE